MSFRKPRFIRDYEEILDPRNARRTISEVHAADMAIAGPGVTSPMSWMAMPAWQPPAHLLEPGAGVPRGRVLERQFDSDIFDARIGRGNVESFTL